MTGGYFKNMHSKLETQKQRKDLISQISRVESELSTLKKQLEEVEININITMSDMQKNEIKNSKSK